MWRIEAFRVLDHLVLRVVWLAPRDSDGVLQASMRSTSTIPLFQLEEGSPDELETLALELINIAMSAENQRAEHGYTR